MSAFVEAEKKSIAEILRRLIEGRQISPYELSRQTGLPHNTIYMILGGKVMPATLTLIALANFFCVTIDYLLGREVFDSNGCCKINKSIPVLQWSDVSDWIKCGLQSRNLKKCQWIEYTDDKSDLAFALEIKSHYVERIFPSFCMIIVNPQKKINDGDYVIIKSEKEEINLWQIKDFNETRYIKPIGIQSDAIQLQLPYRLMGKIVETRKYYN